MTITPIETIKREAEAAVAEGKSKREACRFPFASSEGIEWRKFYDAASNTFENAVAQYRAAIGESSSTR
jgi:Golgi nucleoside diphosphatase